MKSVNFFIAKANEYISVIDGMMPIKKDNSDVFNRSAESKAKAQAQDDIRLKVKLLFSEFDNGQLFTDAVQHVDKNVIAFLDPNDIFEKYKHILNLFIQHIKEFRLEPVTPTLKTLQ